MSDTVDPATLAKTETEKTEALKNEAEPTVTPTPVVEEKKTEDSEVERLRKEAEQAKMEANMLRNKLTDKEKAEEAAKAKELEDNQQYKELLEQERTKREELERAIEAEEKAKELASTKAELLKDYPDEVRGLAEDAGIELADTDDDSVTAFKERLDKVAKRVNVASVGPNNPATPSTGNVNLTPMEIHEMLNDPKKADEFFKKHAKDFPITNMMMQ